MFCKVLVVSIVGTVGGSGGREGTEVLLIEREGSFEIWLACLSEGDRFMGTGEATCVGVTLALGEFGVLPLEGVDEPDFVGVAEGVEGEVERISRENMLRVGVCGVAAVMLGVDGGLV